MRYIKYYTKYYTIDKINKDIDKSHPKAVSLFHCNIRSLPKNVILLNDVIYTLSSKPDVIAVTETKFNVNTIHNIDIPGYNFYHVDSATAAGGAGIYVNCMLKSIDRPDIKISSELVESCWIEIQAKNNMGKNTIIGCIYRHPKSNVDHFTDELEKLLHYFNQCKYQVILTGDFNIDFFQYVTHQPTEKYLDMLYANNFIQLITKPTIITDHSKTLIDHIYTNMPLSEVLSGIAVCDISDHLPVFCVMNVLSKNQQ